MPITKFKKIEGERNAWHSRAAREAAFLAAASSLSYDIEENVAAAITPREVLWHKRETRSGSVAAILGLEREVSLGTTLEQFILTISAFLEYLPFGIA